jgi:hypothetical protein
MNYPAKINHSTYLAMIHLAATIFASIAFILNTYADVLPGAMPKDWPANPAKHIISVHRESADKQQAAMIATAESALPSKETLLQAIKAGDRSNDPLGLNQPKDAQIPAGDKVWWYKEQLGIRIPCAITGDCVAYYSDLLKKYGKQSHKRYLEPSSRLDYHARIKFQMEFIIDGKTFKNVNVVDLKLKFSQTFLASTTEGMHFEKARVVVLDAEGKVLYISGDGPTEVPIFAI